MPIIDQHARVHLPQYLKQCLMATMVVVAILTLLDVAKYPVVVASLGASSFVVFAIPRSYSASTFRISGGYAVGIGVGVGMHYLERVLSSSEILPEGPLGILLGGMAIGLSIFLMVIFNCEHPPAAGLSLGLIFNPWTVEGLAVILSSVVSLCLCKHLLRKWLINLHAPTS